MFTLAAAFVDIVVSLYILQQKYQLQKLFDLDTKKSVYTLTMSKHDLLIAALGDLAEYTTTGWFLDTKCDRWFQHYAKRTMSDLPGDSEIPPPLTHCHCTTEIKYNHLIQHSSGRYEFVGSKCIQQFGDMLRKCVQCGETNNCDSSRCKACRVRCKPCKVFHDDNSVCTKCSDCKAPHQLETDRCGECRLECEPCDAFHADNGRCSVCSSCNGTYRGYPGSCYPCREKQRAEQLISKKCQPPTLYIVPPMQFTFGKHAGRDVVDVLKTDPSYCAWVAAQPWGKNNSELFELIKDARGSDLSWGKHKNKTLEWVSHNAPSYLEWLKKSEYVRDNCPALKAKLENF